MNDSLAYCPLTENQNGIYVEWEKDRRSVKYNIPCSTSFECTALELKEAVRDILNAHPYWKTTLAIRDGVPVQLRRDDHEIEIEILETTEEDFAEECRRRIRPFNLLGGDLFRFTIMQTPEKVRCFIDVHHIITDGTSSMIFFKELKNRLAGKELRPESFSAFDWARDRAALLDSEEHRRCEEYFDRLLEGCTGTALPRSPVVDPTEKTSQLERYLPKADISQFCRRHELTQNTFFLTALCEVLNRVSREETVALTTLSNGRSDKRVASTFGMFVNTLPVVFETEKGRSTVDSVKQIQRQLEETIGSELYSLTEMSLKHGFVSRIHYVCQPGLDFYHSMRLDTSSPLFPVSLEVGVVAGQYCLRMNFDNGIYSATDIGLFLDTLVQLVSNMTIDGDAPLESVPMLTEEGKKLVLELSAGTSLSPTPAKTVSDLLAARAVAEPKRLALEWRTTRWNFAEVFRRVDALARQLVERGVKPGEVVAVTAHRGPETVLALHAVNRAGAAFVPVDPAYPRDRIEFILADSGAKLLLAAAPLPFATDIPVLDLAAAGLFDGRGLGESRATPDGLAYLIYTSGTTGRPKGVMIEHRSLMNYIDYIARILPGYDAALFTNYCFDLTITTLFVPLCFGGRIKVLDGEVDDDLREIFGNDDNHFVKLTPAHLRIANTLLGQRPLPNLKALILGGEELATSLCEETLSNFGDRIAIHNEYGPTEATVGCCDYVFKQGDPGRAVSIGTTISNARIYILQGDELCGIGVPGEICIAGAGVAKGYLNRPELTAEKFVPDPFRGGRMYRSGDLGRLLPDGRIEYLGRFDDQVKIRGFRIELGEIQSRLAAVPGVREAVVIVREDEGSEACLCGYYVSDATLDDSLLRESLRKELPDYMVPQYFVRIASIPVTRNGKVDRRSLPAPERAGSDEYVAPSGESELALAKAFAEVLRVDRIGRDDNFFRLGGHSLKAVKLVNLVESATGARLTINDIFTWPTVGQLAQAMQSHRGYFSPIEAVPPAARYPMSSAQQRFYILNRLTEGDVSYNMPFLLEINGVFDLERLQNAVDRLTAREEILRTGFETVEDEMVQIVHEDARLKIDFEDRSGAAVDADSLFASFIRLFDLAAAPLMRIKIVRLSATKHLMLTDVHHIISDGGSMPILLEELASLYNGEEIPAKKIFYKDYGAWQESRDISEQERYWTNELAGSLPLLDLETDFKRPSEQSVRGDHVAFSLDGETRKLLDNLQRETSATEYMILLTAFMLMLSKYSRQEEIIVGTPVSGRVHADTHEMLGLFVNTLAMKAEIGKEDTFLELLGKMSKKCLAAYDNQEYPFEKLVEKVNVARDTGRNPIFDVMFVLQNNEAARFRLEGAELTVLKAGGQTAKFDLTLSLEENEGRYNADFEYCVDLFRRESIERMADHYRNLLKNALASPDSPLTKIGMLDGTETNLVLEDFNRSGIADWPKDLTVTDLFEKQVRATPDRIAVVFDDRTLTYRQLNEQANALAWKLREAGVGPDDFVGIVTERSLEMVVAIYAVLKAGGCYVPMETIYPKDRIDYMLNDCRPKVVLTGGDLDIGFEAVKYDIFDAATFQGKTKNPPKNLAPENLIYLIYTSGTTGLPKGVMLEHRNVVRLLFNDNFEYDFDERDVWCMFHSFCFDFSVWELFGATLFGGKLVVVPRETAKDTYRFVELVEREGVTVLNQVPSSFYTFIEASEARNISSIRYVIFGGEALTPRYLKLWHENNPQATLVNMYGITETTVHVTWRLIGDEEIERGLSDIGVAIPTLAVYIMNGEELCGIGVPGEICVAGAGVARGYLNRPELTATKFVPNPFGEGLLYRSGDLARWLPDGNMEYLGRIDEQVKIRGFRIELGEIESRLLDVEGIRHAVVIARKVKGGGDVLCAYVVSQDEPDVGRIKDALRVNLPDYMIPSFIIRIESIPLTNNGKLDRRRLPEPSAVSETEYREPKTDEEKAVAAAYREILGLERIGTGDRFFELGGDSIKAIRIVSRLHKLGYAATVKAIMGDKPVAEIAAGLKKASAAVAEQREIVGNVPLTPIQQQFFLSPLKRPAHYNQSLMLETTRPIDTEVLRRTLTALVAHHDMLRVVFHGEKQTILPSTESRLFRLEEFSCEDPEEFDDILRKTEAGIDLAAGPLLHAALIRSGAKNYLFLVIHHLAVDGVSWRIFCEDLEIGYRTALNGKEIRLPEKTVSFKTWSTRLDTEAKPYFTAREKRYWERIDQKAAAGRIARDVIEGLRESSLGRLEVVLDAENTKELLYQAGKAYNTEINDLLLAALVRAVNKITGQGTVSIELEGHGREEILDDVSVTRTVGWFTTLYPTVFEDIGDDLGADIRTVKESLRAIPNKGIGYGILRQMNARHRRGSIGADMTFNYMGEFAVETPEGTVFDLSRQRNELDVAPENRFGTPIAFNGVVREKELNMVVSYERSMYSDAMIQRLTEAFHNELKTIVSHCVAQEHTVYTRSDFGENEWDQSEFETIAANLEKEGLAVERVIPLTPMQEGMLFFKIADETGTNYVVQYAFDIRSGLDAENVRKSVHAMCEKHGLLRTAFIYRNVSKPRQVMLKSRPAEFEVIDLAGRDDAQARLVRVEADDVRRGFDLEHETLFRVKLIRTAENEYRMIWTFHHIVMDGWSMSILFHDFLRFYGTAAAGEPIEITPSHGYEEFVRKLLGRDRTAALEYWKKLAEGYDEQAIIPPIDRPEETDEEAVRVEIALEPEVYVKATKLCLERSVTINDLVETAWGVLLQKYNGSSDVMFGKVISGRNTPGLETENLVGIFVNTVPVRVASEKGMSFSELLGNVGKQGVETSAYDFCSLAEIQEATKLGNAMVGTIMAFENYYVRDMDNRANLDVVPAGAREQTNYDLSLIAFVSGDRLNLALMYDTRKYGREEVELVLRHLKNIISAAVANPGISVDAIDMLDEAERQSLLDDFNDTRGDFQSDKILPEILSDWIRLRPDRIALVEGDRQITYRQFGELIDNLTLKLVVRDVNAGDFVGLYAHRSINTIVAMFAILKAGGVYVPLDPSMPEDRIRYIMSDCEMKLVLGKKEEMNVETGIETFDITTLDDRVVECDIDLTNTPDDLCYMIYTSGTTGVPKGVMITHRNVVNFCTNSEKSEYQRHLIEDTDYILATNKLFFDITLQDIHVPLLNGKSVIVLTDEQLTGKGLDVGAFVGKYRRLGLNTTPSKIKYFLSEESFRKILGSVSVLMIGAEELERNLFEDVRKYTDAVVFNGYGPTETTCGTLYCRIDRSDRISLGRPMLNTRMRILRGDSLCGIGVPGELCIAGEGVAPGYMNKYELTLQKFVADPFGEGKMYRSGDLVRWLPGGEVAFMGRIDEQVKIRGFRIELGEISSRLQDCPGVSNAVAVVKTDDRGEKYLCGYVVSDDSFDMSAIKNTLRGFLPEYMVPAFVLRIDAIPFGENGKLNRRALPEPDKSAWREFVPPRTETETRIAKLFEETLEIESVGALENFFESGGHSLRAMRLLNLLNVRLGTRLAVADIFENPTVESLARRIDRLDVYGETAPIVPCPLAEVYPVSSAQNRLYILDCLEGAEFNDTQAGSEFLLESGSGPTRPRFDRGRSLPPIPATVYNIPACLKIEGSVDLGRLQAAVNRLVTDNRILRTSFEMRDGIPVQRIRDELTLPVVYRDLTGRPFDLKTEFARFVRPFDLAAAPLFRIELLKTSEKSYYLLTDIHHIIGDGGSLPILFSWIARLYNGDEVPRQRVQYNDFCVWQKMQDTSEREHFWLDMYAEPAPVLNLQTDFPRPQTQSFEGANFDFTLGADCVRGLERLRHETGATDYMIFMATFMTLLGKYAAQEDVVVGTPVSGRVHADTHEMLGMFVNTLALRAEPKRDKTFLQFLDEIKKVSLEAFENQEYPFEELVEKTNVPRELSRNPLFDVMLVLQNYEKPSFRLGEASLAEQRISSGVAKFDLTLFLTPGENEYRATFEYCTALFRPETVERLAAHFANLLREIAGNPKRSLAELPLIDENERKWILDRFPAPSPTPLSKTVSDLLAARADAEPKRLALEWRITRWDFAEVFRRVDALARQLVERGVKPGEVVAVTAHRCPETVLALHAVNRAGAAFVPVDPAYPRDRIEFILADSGAKLLLAAAPLPFATDIPVLDLAAPGLFDGAGLGESRATPDGLAYLIYTSGTTGRPKGVMIEHRSLMNYIDYIARILPGYDAALFTNYCFDLTITTLFVPFCFGGRIKVLDGEVDDDLREIFGNDDNHFVKLTPAHLRIANTLLGRRPLPNLKALILGGEELETSLCEETLSNFGDHIAIHNEYGPTEATVGCCDYVFQHGDPGRAVSIGTTISNARIYIMQGDELCGIGVPGEICIAGDGVAKGYLNRPELTAEKFVPDPFRGGRMYRSGDLGRLLPDGRIEYLGRFDDQVKIRGFRIELGEIQSRLATVPGVREAVVIVREDEGSEACLCGYYVSDAALDDSLLRESLRKELPDYMVPQYFVRIASIPVTRNGKVDRRSLPAPERAGSDEYVAPTGESELALAKAFAEVLRVDRIGRDDNFFRFGGDSIKAIRICTKLRQFGYRVGVKSIMNGKTIANIAKETVAETDSKPAEQGEVTGEIPLTAIQSEFLSAPLQHPEYFNQSFLLKSRDRLNRDSLEAACSAIVAQHDMLRAGYEDGKQIVFSSAERAAFSLEEIECPEKEIDTRSNAIQQGINLARGPLLKTAVFHTPESDYLLLVIHHLVVDGVSWRILLEDLQTAYLAASAGREIRFPLKTTSFKEWSEAVRKYRKNHLLLREKSFWAKAGQLAVRNRIPRDGSGEKRWERVSFALSEEDTRKLLRSADAYGTEINDLLCTGLARAIRGLSGKSETGFLLEGHGREEIGAEVDISRTVGWFTSLYPVAFDSIGGDLRSDIIRVKETLHRIPNKGIGYGILTGFETSRPETPDITFNYLGESEAGGAAGADAIFELSDLPHGSDVAPENMFGTPISINGGVRGGVLRMTISYDGSLFRETTVERLTASLKENLEAIAGHCASQTTTTRTASDLGETVWNDAEFRTVLAGIESKGDRIERIYPLTPMQEGMLYYKILDDHSTDYVVQYAFKVSAELDVPAINDALAALARKHAVLRTAIAYRNLSVPRQMLLQKRPIEFSFEDLTGREDRYDFVEHARAEDVARGFDLENDSLLRIKLFKTGSGEYRMIWCFHHMIMDGWCMSIIFTDFLRYLDILSKGGAIPVETGGEYEAYVRRLDRHDKETSLAYWKKLLEGYQDQATIVPMGRPDAGVEPGTLVEETLDVQTTQTLSRLAGEYGVTVNTFVEAALGVLLQKYNRAEDVVFGKVVSGRNVDIPGVEDMVGLFINTVPVRIVSAKEQTFKELLLGLQQQAVDSTPHDYCPLSEIQGQSPLGSGLVDVLLAFENYYVRDTNADGAKFEIEHGREETNYPISFSASLEETLRLGILYDTARYGRAEIALLLDHLKTILETVAENPEIETRRIRTISRVQEELIRGKFNDTDSPYDENLTVIDVFEENVRKHPGNTAIEFGDERLSYAEFNEYVNGLAERLRGAGVGPETFVVLSTQRSLQMMLAIYAILKAGGVYVPVSPDYPENRVRYVLEDCKPKVVLTGPGGSVFETEIPVIDLCDWRTLTKSAKNPRRNFSSENLAYTIYTSGTTGNPKGVMVEHRNLAYHMNSLEKVFKINERFGVTQTSSFVFDASIFQIFIWIYGGGRIILPPPGAETDPDVLMDCLKKHRATVTELAPSLFASFNDALDLRRDKKEILQNLDVFVTGGEALLPETVDRFLRITAPYKKVLLKNSYGPTEGTISVSFHLCKENEKRIPIGTPQSNTKIYILDENDRLCGIGVPGELCITGKFVTRGYLNRPDLTAEKFVPNPFGEGRMYRTGDLTRWLPDGEIDFMGRIDEQVKIRGYRIELGEIASRLLEIPGIRDAAVLAPTNQYNYRYICAWIVAETKQDIAAIKDALKVNLPEYMVPAHILQIDALPLTPNKKLDRRALPAPDFASPKETITPRNKAEETVVEAFKEILGVDNIGIQDDFFELGGDSLKVIRFVCKIGKKYKIGVKEIQQLRTPERIAARIAKETKSKSAFKIMRRGTPSIFLFPPVGGMSFVYENMLDVLDYRGSVYSMDDPKFECDELDEMGEITPEELIDIYADALERNFSDGDILIGYSFGGYVAHETAARLESRGWKVGRLVFIDVILNEFVKHHDPAAVEAFFGVESAKRLGITLTAEETVLPPNEMIRRIAEKAAKSPEEKESIENTLARIHEVTRLNREANIRNTEPINADLSVVFTSDSMNAFERLPDSCQKLTRGRYEYGVVDGTHESIMEEHAGGLAEALNDCLRRTC